MAPPDMPPLPARMVNEYVYCPRLFYLEYVQGEWADSADTEDGRHVHRRVDRRTATALPAPATSDEDGESSGDPPPPTRSVELTSAGEGITAIIDLLEHEPDGTVVPVDYKRGKVPDTPGGAYEPERVQLAAQALILRANGYPCDRGVLYFAGSRQRVTVVIDDALVEQTRTAVADARDASRADNPPTPLEDSPKCVRCSLHGICLPDEHHALRRADERAEERDATTHRRLIPANGHALPLYVQTAGAKIGLRKGRLVVRVDDKQVHSQRMIDTSQICLIGNVQVSSQATRVLMEEDIPVLHFTSTHQFRALTHGMPSRNIALRRAQFRYADDPEATLAIARRLVATKIANQRTQLRRNLNDAGPVLAELGRLAKRAARASSMDTLLGLEGNAARAYFSRFAQMLRPPGDADPAFDFTTRNRRPPTDPVNAMLSFGYALLAKDWCATLLGVGFDPCLGYLHTPHRGRPSLALDLMEEFRPVIVDSAVITAVNNGAVTPADFIQRGPAVAMKPAGRRRFIKAYEQRIRTEATHPVFRYKVSYRRIFEVQARLLGRYLTGEIGTFPQFRTR